jgi:hypothetical protein
VRAPDGWNADKLSEALIVDLLTSLASETVAFWPQKVKLTTILEACTNIPIKSFQHQMLESLDYLLY